MKIIKVKGNQHADLHAVVAADGDVVQKAVSTRLMQTEHGGFFRETILEAIGSGKWDNPEQMVGFCYRATLAAFHHMDADTKLAISCPPDSAIVRKANRDAQQEEADDEHSHGFN